MTAWMGENDFAAVPVALYAVVLLMCGAAFNILQQVILRVPGANEALADAIGMGRKEKASIVGYVLAIPAALLGVPAVSGVLFVAVAAMWLVPDRRVERQIVGRQSSGGPA